MEPFSRRGFFGVLGGIGAALGLNGTRGVTTGQGAKTGLYQAPPLRLVTVWGRAARDEVVRVKVTKGDGRVWCDTWLNGGLPVQQNLDYRFKLIVPDDPRMECVVYTQSGRPLLTSWMWTCTG